MLREFGRKEKQLSNDIQNKDQRIFNEKIMQ